MSGESAPALLQRTQKQIAAAAAGAVPPSYEAAQYTHASIPDGCVCIALVQFPSTTSILFSAVLGASHSPVHMWEFPTDQYVDSARLPVHSSAPVDSVAALFVSPARLADFARAAEYHAGAAVQRTGGKMQPQHQPAPPAAPSMPPAAHSAPADSPLFASVGAADAHRRNPLSIGQKDLDPLAASNMGPPRLGSFAPPPLFPSAGGGDGMSLGPHHEIFQHGPGRVPPAAPSSGDEFLPPGAVPPGARFDPVSPLDPLGQLGRPPRPPGGGTQFRSGDPDWNDLPPPGRFVRGSRMVD
ncbi:hypothetical protein MSPP1_003393 [Malassezia sp. CBS 17886]|nr:hypothetical protein MSPP1_003393 [Malassezia sp. CBS 17886]